MYVVPAAAENETELDLSVSETSSLAPTSDKADTDEPVKTPSSVSKLEPAVVTVTVPAAGAVQRYQTEAPPGFPATVGSPDSFVAPTFVPDTEPDPPESAAALANMSFAGAGAAAAWLQLSVIE